MFRSRPIREAMIFVGLSFLIAVLIALMLPHSDLAVVLSALIPVLSVAIMTFTVFRRGERKAMWAGIGLQRAGWRWWPAAIAGPVIVVTSRTAQLSCSVWPNCDPPPGSCRGFRATACHSVSTCWWSRS